MQNWIKKLEELGACSEAVEWAKKQPDAKTAWVKCPRADWMLWIAARTAKREVVVQAACDCAETALEYLDGAPLLQAMLTLHITREWAEGREDLETVSANAAAYAAADAANAANAAAAAAAHAANAAAAAAHAAAYDAAAHYAAADAAHAAAYAANAAAYAAANAAARKRALRRMATIVRKRIPYGMLEV